MSDPVTFELVVTSPEITFDGPVAVGNPGPRGPVGTTLHAELTDRDISGHPATVIATTGPAGWVTTQEAIDGLHALAVALADADTDLAGALEALGTALEAADTAEAQARAAADTAEITARNSAISAAIAALVNGAPGILDTLGEIAAALADDDDAIAALTTAVNARATTVALTAEKNRALAAEGALDDAIGDEETARVAAISAAVTNLVGTAPASFDTLGEITSLIFGINEDLSTRINSEASTRHIADLNLNTTLNSEAQARAAADTTLTTTTGALRTDLTAETSRATTVEATKATTTALTTETNRATAAETALDTRVTTVKADLTQEGVYRYDEDVRINAALGLVSNRVDQLDVGEMVPPSRVLAFSGSLAQPLSTGRLMLHFFTAEKTETVTAIETYTGGTAAVATPTLIRLGIYQIDGAGNGTLIASTPNDLTLYTTTFTTYLRTLTPSFAKVRGQRYAVALLCVSAVGVPGIYSATGGGAAPSDTMLGRSPRIGGMLAGQTDLPGSFTSASIAGYRVLAVARLVP
jgi:hypothetical protein